VSEVISLRGKENAFAAVYDKIQSGKYKDGYAQLADDLHEAYELKDHPKRGLLFLMAFHRGVSGGHVGILREYDELSNLLI
jgi:hypothetical protein